MYKRKSKPNNNFAQKNMAKGGKLKPVKENQKGLKKLPEDVRNKMGFMEMGGKLTKGDKEFMYGGKMSMPGFKGFTGMSSLGIPKSDKPARRKKKMMKGGKMNYPGGGMMKKGSMYPGGGRTQLD